MRATVAICCYNAEGTIERAILSARNLRWDDLEILICDDASTDISVEIIERIAITEPRLRLVRHEINQGVAATRNTLVREATGEILAFLDDDDECIPKRLEEQVRLLRQVEAVSGQSPVACYGSRLDIRENGDTKVMRSIGHSGAVGGDAVALHLLCGTPLVGTGKVGTCTLLARTQTFRDIPFDPNFRRAEDREWAVRLAQAGGRFISSEFKVIARYNTVGADKSEHKHKMARHKMVLKHRAYLRSNRAYLAALALHQNPNYRFPGFRHLGHLLNQLLRPKLALKR